MTLTYDIQTAFSENATASASVTSSPSVWRKPIIRPSTRKQLFDYCFAALVIIFILSWFVPLMALLIKLESKGPVFFKQLRTGQGGHPFYCLKFRSMTLNSEADSQQARKGDNRITKLGAFLRQTSLDELPQFINVLRGEMSIVGPRPHMLHHTAEYSQAIPHFMDRLQILPGITGLAQISGYRGETKEVTAMENRVNADIHYINNRSAQMDLKIIALTVAQVIKKDCSVF
ncbi:exopolysaccharide biosynthesis protein [Hymenobacter sp. RP-2-7]|uniref:Exopolysaccharide biosynthesis protein n=1 Tax=Hymenobacter polaris TaxID=2682546 RepID=A0A7Y0AGP2_9BACT|nr:sugar transferase [Hymenobacter polaris]NML66997.1 exopolysaccharide biosynthesis protein [Hymenobacter polaris]